MASGDARRISPAARQPLEQHLRASTFSILTTRRRKSGTPLNVMVVGPPKAGKTTFLRTLQKSIQAHEGAVVRQVPQESEVPFSPAEQEQDDSLNKSVCCEALPGDERPTTSVSAWPPLEIDQFAEKVQFAMIDTPGLIAGSPSYEGQLNRILSDIESRFESTLVEEFKVQRNPRRALDTHVHVVLYIISPMSGLTEDEIPILRKLSSRANVIPCLGQADLITKRRMDMVKRTIMEKIRKHNIPVFTFGSENEEDEEDPEEEKDTVDEDVIVPQERQANYMDNDDAEEEHKNLKKENVKLHDSLPFTLIGSEPDDIHLVEEGGQLVRVRSKDSFKASSDTGLPEKSIRNIIGREYNWGIIDVDNADHCDLSTLKYVLFTSHMYTLKERTRNIFYEKYRTERLLAHKASMNDSSLKRPVSVAQQSEAPESSHTPDSPGSPVPPVPVAMSAASLKTGGGVSSTTTGSNASEASPVTKSRPGLRPAATAS